jgi:dTDP-4-amino-4,6-dideoxygalactose transaminase
MEVLNKRIEKRRNINTYYKDAFKSITGLKFLTEPSKDFFSNYWLTTIIVDEKSCGFTCNDIRIQLEKENIESRFLWKPMHLQPIFQNEIFYSNQISEQIFNSGLCLPSGTNLTNKELDIIIEIIFKLFKL